MINVILTPVVDVAFGGEHAGMRHGNRSIQLIVAADEPALLFSSVEAAEQYLEVIDVRDGVYTAAFGPTGDSFNIGVEGERVVIRRTHDEPRPERLVELLRLVVPAEDRSDDLAALLDRLGSHISA